MQPLCQTKFCPSCLRRLPLSDFTPSQLERPYGCCRECACARSSRSHKRHPETSRRASSRYREKLRQEILEAYGGECACCGEDEPRFLTLDHVEGGGIKHRKRLNPTGMGGVAVYQKVRQQGFPATYQLLCWNCNCAKGVHGKCPHQE